MPPTLDQLPTIRGERVALRWLRREDIGALFEIFSHPEVMRFWSSAPLADEDGAALLLDRIHDCFQRRELFQWGLVLQRDNLVMGTCTLAQLDEEHRRAELGFALGREHWGNGYMREALAALLDFAFGELQLHRLEADVDPRNAASIHLLERLGFKREGHLRERWWVNGEAQDALLYGLLQREWSP